MEEPETCAYGINGRIGKRRDDGDRSFVRRSRMKKKKMVGKEEEGRELR